MHLALSRLKIFVLCFRFTFHLAMNSLFGKRKKFEINTADLEYKVHYLGNVMTSIMKGDGCVDKAVNILWDNHLRNKGRTGIKMNLALTQGGLKVETDPSGVTEYYGHRIHYIIAHPLHSKLFVWVYQHVGRNLKTELRCHGVLCKRSKDAKLIAYMLNERLERTFVEYKREKKRMQTTRLCSTKNRIFLLESKQKQQQQPMRNKSLSSTIKFYKPPVQKTMVSAPKLDDVKEDDELIDEEVDEGGQQNTIIEVLNLNDLIVDDDLIEKLSHKFENDSESLIIKKVEHNQHSDDAASIYSNTCDSGIEESFTINYEFGNDVEQLKQDKELIKAYQELLQNKLKLDEAEGDDELIVESISSQLNKLPIDTLTNTNGTNNSPTKIVSYNYLGDLIDDENKFMKKTKSFRLNVKSSNNQSENDKNSFYLCNPFKRLQLSSSFSGYSTFEKYKLKQQELINKASNESKTTLQQVLINC